MARRCSRAPFSFDSRTPPCPVWVRSDHFSTSAACPLYPRKRTFGTMFAGPKKAAGSLQPIVDLVEPGSRAGIVELGPGRPRRTDGADDLVV